jgi:HNH endonuclease
MSSPKPCLYCPASASSEEHVISEALGCKETIKQGVCRTCNSAFGHTFEAKFINELALFLNLFRIPNRQGTVPSVRLRGKMGSEEFNFVLRGDGKVEVPPRLLSRGQTTEGHERKFRLFRKAHEQKIEGNLRSKHPNLNWGQLREGKAKLVFDARPQFDVKVLCGADASRSVAKYAVNLLTRECGYNWAKDNCRAIISFVKGELSVARAGVLWEPDLLRRFPLAPPKHLFVIVCDSRSHTVAVFLYLFCLLPFCVLTENPGVLVDTIKTGALDPHKGRFTPLFLSGSPAMLQQRDLPPFPMPEFEFSDELRHAEIGTLRQANLAAGNAHAFLRAVYSAESEVRHVCYNCGKILAGLTPLCEFCGKSPVPEEAAGAE